MVYKSVQKGKTTKTTKLVSLISSKHKARTDPWTHTQTHTHTHTYTHKHFRKC